MVIYITLTFGMLPLGSTASRYPPITLLQEGIHSCRDFIHLAIGILYMISYRTVGMKTDGYFCPYLLSPTAPAPHTRCIGDVSLALLATFEANQQTTPERGPQEAGSSTRPCNAPSATPAAKPRPLQRVIERCSPPAMPTKLKGKQWLQCRHSAAMGLASWKRENELYCYL